MGRRHCRHCHPCGDDGRALLKRRKEGTDIPRRGGLGTLDRGELGGVSVGVGELWTGLGSELFWDYGTYLPEGFDLPRCVFWMGRLGC